MRLRRSANGDALPGAGFDAFARALVAMAWVVMCWAKIRQAVIVARRDVVDRVGAGEAAEVADVAVEGENLGLGAGGGLPVGREPATAIRVLPVATGHGRTSSSLVGSAAHVAVAGEVVGLQLITGERVFGVVAEVGPNGELTIVSSCL